MSCKPLKIKKPTRCHAGFSGIGSRVYIPKEEFEELVRSGKVMVFEQKTEEENLETAATNIFKALNIHPSWSFKREMKIEPFAKEEK